MSVSDQKAEIQHFEEWNQQQAEHSSRSWRRIPHHVSQLQRQRAQDSTRRHAQNRFNHLLRVNAAVPRRQGIRVRRWVDLLQHGYQQRELHGHAFNSENDKKEQLRSRHHESDRGRQVYALD